MKQILRVTLPVVFLATLSVSVVAQSERDDSLKREANRAQLALLEKQIPEPSDQDKIAYTDFLRQPDTGLTRLLPREKYDNGAYSIKPPSSLTIRGGGAYYSFTYLSHDYNSGSPDISLDKGILSVGFAGANYGMLTSLGNVPIEQITVEHPSVQFMAEYVTTNEEPEARAEFRRFGQGVTIGGALYKSRLPARVDTTYLLRSISYISSDVLVTFRIVRQDTDGSVIIVWKLLKKYPTPKLARNN